MGEYLLVLAVGAICLVLYMLRLNWVLSHTPQEVANRAGKPLTRDYVRDVFERVKREGIDWEGKLPPKKDRRYIVVGGSGFLGGQIILHLLAMGTPPEAIRIFGCASACLLLEKTFLVEQRQKWLLSRLTLPTKRKFLKHTKLRGLKQRPVCR